MKTGYGEGGEYDDLVTIKQQTDTFHFTVEVFIWNYTMMRNIHFINFLIFTEYWCNETRRNFLKCH